MSDSDENASRVGMLIAGYTIPIVFMLLSTGLRLLVRIHGLVPNDGFHLDDYLILLATILEVAYCATVLHFGVNHGYGRHSSTLHLSDLETFLKGEYIASHLYNVGLATVKLSILALYYRVFPLPLFSYTIIGCGIFILLWIATIEISMGLLCRSIEAFWNRTIEGHCLNSTTLTYYINASNMITDIVLFALPIAIIVPLRISRNKKIALCIVFSIGFTTCGISAARLATVSAESSADITWVGVPLGILSAFESLGGILCANLPTIYRPLKKAAQRMTGRSDATSSGRLHEGRSSIINTHTHTPTSNTSRRWRRSNVASEHWMGLPSGSLLDDVHTSKGVQMGGEPDSDVVELRPVVLGTITVQREIHQDVDEV